MRGVRIFPRLLRRLRRDERGVSVIEMALLAPVLSVFTIGIADLGRAFAERYALQQSIHRTLERGQITGPTAGTYTYLAAEAAEAAGGGATATVTEWVECTSTAGVRRRETTSTACVVATPTTAGEEFARYVEINATKTYTPLFTGRIFATRNANGTVPLVGKASIRVQ
jgi:Flp pilus assembly protein TadG